MSVFGGPEISTDGLVVALDATNSKSYPGSGTTWFDISGKNNHATISSGEYVSSGFLQNSGNTSNFFTVSLSDSSTINAAFSKTTGGWTIEELIYTYSVTYPESDGGSVVSSAAYGATATGFDWNHGQLNTNFQFGVTSSGNAGSTYDKVVDVGLSAPFSSLNVWKLRTMQWDRTNNTVSLYINGVYQGGGSISEVEGQTLYDGNGMVFGSLYGWKHYGRRSMIRIYDKLLTTSEIRQNFNAIRARYSI
jgi:hypothetical protein